MPTTLPLFPLEQPLLLPGTVVPFAATEEGERNLVDDAMAADRYVAIIQPLADGSPAAPARAADRSVAITPPLADGPPAARALAGRPPVYQVGCVGYIGECHETE